MDKQSYLQDGKVKMTLIVIIVILCIIILFILGINHPNYVKDDEAQSKAVMAAATTTPITKVNSSVVSKSSVNTITGLDDAAKKTQTASQTASASQNSKQNFSLTPTQKLGVFKRVAVQQSAHEKYQKQFAEAAIKLKNYDVEDSKKILKQLIKAAPRYQQAYVGLAKVYLQQKDFYHAENVVNQGLKQFPQYVPLITLKARILLKEHKIEVAESLMESVSPQLRNNIDYYMTMAVIEQRMGKYLFAAQIYFQLLNYNEHEGLWWLGAAVNLESAGKNNAALDAYKRAIESDTLQPFLVAYSKMQINELN